METLNTIQILSKLGKVLSKIVYVCCIVAISGCVVGFVAMLIGAETLKLGGVTIHSILETEVGVSEGTIIAAILVGAVLSIGEYFVARMAYRYFDNELKVGTPFTLEGAKELLHLGISTIWIPVVSMVLAQMAQGVIAEFMENVDKLDLDGYDSIAIGVIFIFMSLLCKYGAELRQSKESNIEETP